MTRGPIKSDREAECDTTPQARASNEDPGASAGHNTGNKMEYHHISMPGAWEKELPPCIRAIGRRCGVLRDGRQSGIL